ncbi:hypothetical protein BGZ76_008002 [Entomortierella beljakovae]|nr:hypothetical protein BGZ76_008002 [Entomortierella beljakovae]
MATKGDPYLSMSKLSFDKREMLDHYLFAIQRVIDRHDILRTCIMWENLSTPAQVVLRQAKLSVTELSLDPTEESIVDQISKLTDPRERSIDLTQGPLIRFTTAQDVDGRWIAGCLIHHIIGDQSAMKVMKAEIKSFMEDQDQILSNPQPFRNLIAQVRSGPGSEIHEQFFTKMLADIDSPALPYGLSDVHNDGLDVTQSRLILTQDLSSRLRGHAKRMGLSLASLCHLAWAQVISKTSGQEKVVFGTVLFGRMQGGSGSDQVMGMFINTLPIRIDVGGSSVEESVRQTQSDLAALLEHEHASLALAQRCSSIPAGTPLFSALLNYRHNAVPSTEVSEIAGMKALDGQDRTNYPFMISIDDGGSTLGLTAQVVKQFDSSRICGYMQQALQSLVDALDHAPSMEVRKLEILPDSEREILIQSWNDTTSSYSEYRCIHHLFQDQVVQSPNAIAIMFEDQKMSYHELNARANSLAHHLINLGVKPDSLVAICVDRSLAMIIGLLAVLKAGGAYVPLDPTFASERIYDILADASPSILLADNSGIEALGSISESITVIDPNAELDMPTFNPHVSTLTPHHLVYVIYTSGSTGKPKGVLVEHIQLTRLFDATADWFNFDENDTWIITHSFSFDFSVWEIWGALRYGGKLIIPSLRITQSLEELYQMICLYGITVLNITPSAFRPLIRFQAQSDLRDKLRYVIFGGESLEPSTLQSWYDTRPENLPKLVNMYGITETTVHVTYRVIKPEDCSHAASPIGVRIPDLTLYVLDTHGQPVPLGAVGELCVGGAGVTRGYLNRPELTSEKFPLDPFRKTEGARMYKTGDLVRYLPDGNMIFLGRNDHQVKIRGYRIELGEIEAQILDHPLVRETAVLAFGEGSSKRLIAYVVADSKDGLVHILREHASSKLPEYMIPAAFVRLDTLPLTSNGKLDRRALPEPDISAFVSQEYEAPQGEIESTLANIWAELLKVVRIGRQDNFFMLGGHSLLAVQMIERLRRVKLEISVRALFETPILSVLAQSITKSQTMTGAPRNLITPSTTRITPELLPLIDLTQDDIDLIVSQVEGGIENIQDIYVLSPLQDGMLFHHMMATVGDPYLVTIRLSFDSKDILDRYLASAQKVVDRHDILRTAIMWESLSAPAQVVLRHARLSITELSLDPMNGSILDQLVKLTDPRQHRIDLTKAPLIQFVIAQDVDDRWILVELIHHIIDDNSTMALMMNEIQTFMKFPGQIMPEPVPYRNLIAQVRSGSNTEALEQFFSKMLAEIDTPSLPYGLLDVHGEGMDVTESHHMLPQDLNDRLRGHAKRMGVSVASICHLAWAQVISKTSGEERVVFGTVLFGRMQGGSGSERAMGMFINTLPIRIDVGSGSVEESVRRTQADLAALFEHEQATLALAQRCSGITPGIPLFSSLLNCRHKAANPTQSSYSMNGIRFIEGQERTNYPFTMSVDDNDKEFKVTSQAACPVDASRICGYMQQALQSLVNALDHTPKMQVRNLDIVPVVERQMLIRSWNSTDVAYSDVTCIHQLFENQVKLSPDAIAVVYGDQSLTYRELNDRSNRCAVQLWNRGVQPGDFVATMLERSFELIITQIATLKLGAAYVPIDPKAPPNRQSFIINDCGAKLLVIEESANAPVESEEMLLRLTNDNSCKPDTHVDVANFKVIGSSLDIAYAMYTSGSTGVPKGVLVPHRAIARLTINNGYADIGPDDCVAFSANPAFDASTFEVWAPLLNGGRIIIIDTDSFTDSRRLSEAIHLHSITTMFLTTVLFNQFVSSIGSSLAKLRYLLCGGEQENLDSFSTLLQYGGPQHLIHCYGPTETTTFATTYRVTKIEDSQNRLPIGKPISNTAVYVLDSSCQPVPLGVVGELYIGGTGVANGYLNRPKLTKERFLHDPFSGNSESRMYRTGDLVRYLPDGNLVFVSRNDHQVKIRGFRIELGEIEARLLEHLEVSEAAVLAIGEGSGKRLVAYVVDLESDGLTKALREHVAAKLPEYMVPAAFVLLDILPLTPNGKLDRRALPEPDISAFVSQEYEAPQGEIESTLANIWAELLKVVRIGRQDNFFMLGGHSLLAVQMIERLRRVKLEISVRALFETPILSVLAQSITKSQTMTGAPRNLITPSTTRITPELLPLIDLTQDDIDLIVSQVEGGIENIQDIYALSPLQDGILFHHMMTTAGDPYLIVTRMSFDNKNVLDRYFDAVQKVVDRHDILRTAIMWESLSAPAQVVLRHARLSITELSLSPEDGPIADQIMDLTDPREHRIELIQAPLIRYVIAQNTDGSWTAVQILHHIIGDNSTMAVMGHEIHAFLGGNAHALPNPQSFRNLIAQVRYGPSIEVHEQFFSSMLADIDTPSHPFGLSDIHDAGVDFMEANVLLPHELNDRLRGHAKRMGVSVATMCHLAWAQVISRTSGQEQVVFGTVLLGRMQGGSGSDRVMGLFINTLPLRVDIGSDSIEKSLRQTQADLAALLEHEHASLASAQRCSGIPAGTHIFSAILNCRNHSNYRKQTSDTLVVSGMNVHESQMRTNYPFTMSVDDYGSELRLTSQVASSIDASRVCRYMQQALQSLVDALDCTPKMQVRDLEILPTAENEMLLRAWNNNNKPYPENLCMHQLFEDLVKQTPDAIAVVYEGQKLTYHELNERSNRLAHHLIRLGVKPDSLVAICVDRSLAMIVGLLAVLKAGGAYVPLDPTFACERLHDILTDASPSILLADGTGIKVLGSSISVSMEVVDPNVFVEMLATNPYVPTLDSCHLAYVIYTSGSTGKPKGVMIEHKGATNMALTRPSVYGVGPSSRMLQFFSLGFDGSVQEIFSALCSGGSLYVIPNHIRQDQSQLWEYLDRHSITHAIMTPTSLQQHQVLPKLRTPLTLILGGEALPPALLMAVRALIPNGCIKNDYGPTEVTVDAIVWDCPDTFDGHVVPLGRSYANKKIYILDSNMKPVPIGVAGELYIGGAGVARGYLNRPDLTAKAFFSDPFAEDNKSRMYRTGDLVRYLPDGNVTFIGRNDHQVKIRGYRIELGEIEARLVDNSLVREAVVLALGEGSSKRLVAYVVAELTTGLAHTLRTYISSKLPDYMVPAAFVRLDILPLTPNGKLDRRALPEPDIDAFVSQEYESPQSDIEFALSTIWAELLRVDRVGRHDNFFMLGGHSLLAVRMASQIRSKFGLNMQLHLLFEAPTLALLASRIVQSGVQHEVAYDTLLPLKPHGSRAPLFCIHPAFGFGWSYVALTQHLHPDQPLYALQSRGIDGNGELAESFDDIVQDYIHQIKRAQPRGPYHLLGWSFGGSVAHSMAVQLVDRGDEVSLLALMDTTTDYSMVSEDIDSDHDEDEYASHLARSSYKNTLEVGKALWMTGRHVLRNNIRLSKQFSPSVFAGNMIYFQAAMSDSVVDPSIWASYIQGTIKAHQVDCTHLEMDKPASMAVIGRILAMNLEELRK